MDYIFILSHRGDRTNIMADFKVLSLPMVVKSIKADKYGQYRYAKIGGTSSIMSGMSLKEYNTLFKDVGFTPKQVSKHFSSEISKIYGVKAIQNSKRKLKRKELEVGRVYEELNGSKSIYFGKCKVTGCHKRTSHWQESESIDYEKYCCINYYYSRYSDGKYIDIESMLMYYYGKQFSGDKHSHTLSSISFSTLNSTVTPRKYVEGCDVDKVIDVPKVLEIKDTDGSWLKIEFLEVK